MPRPTAGTRPRLPVARTPVARTPAEKTPDDRFNDEVHTILREAAERRQERALRQAAADTAEARQASLEVLSLVRAAGRHPSNQ